MTKRKRRYHCKHCGSTKIRVSDKKWIKSWCVKAGKDVRVVLVKGGKAS